MSTDDRYKRWMLIVREHLVAANYLSDPKYPWRQQFDDGQTPQAAVKAYIASR